MTNSSAHALVTEPPILFAEPVEFLAFLLSRRALHCRESIAGRQRHATRRRVRGPTDFGPPRKTDGSGRYRIGLGNAPAAASRPHSRFDDET